MAPAAPDTRAPPPDAETAEGKLTAQPEVTRGRFAFELSSQVTRLSLARRPFSSRLCPAYARLLADGSDGDGDTTMTRGEDDDADRRE